MALVRKKLRKMVSHANKNKRLQEDGLDLDLTYITDKVIAMGYPGSGVESTWRNNMSDVARFLDARHADHYKVWNVSDRPYDHAKFHGRVVELGWPDHHAPPLELLEEAVRTMDEWLSAHEDNVAVVHCLAGRGRTGTVVVSYFLKSGQFAHHFEALDYYASKRSTVADKFAAWMPSQKRYMGYYYELLHGKLVNHVAPRPLVLSRIIINTIPEYDGSGGCRPYCVVFVSRRLVHCSSQTLDGIKSYYSSDAAMSFPINVPVRGDVLVKFHHVNKRLNSAKRENMFRLQFNTHYINMEEGGMLRLTRKDVDGAHKEKHAHHYSSDFFLDLMFTPYKGDNFEADTPTVTMGELEAWYKEEVVTSGAWQEGAERKNSGGAGLSAKERKELALAARRRMRKAVSERVREGGVVPK